MKDFALRRRSARAFYQPLEGHAAEHVRVGWESAHAHRLRLAAAVQGVGGGLALGALATVLDAGCGEGGLVPVLRGAGFEGHYRGEDVLDRMISAATARHGTSDTEFEVADSFDVAGPSADVVICSGALNTVIEGAHPDEVFRQALEALWERTRRVLSVDVAIADRHPPGAQLAAVDAGAAFQLARRLCRAPVWRENGIFGEVQLVLWRDRSFPLAGLGADVSAVQRADLLLQAREAEAAKLLLATERSDEGRLLRAIADAQLGRLRDAERSLRALVAGGEQRTRAGLHLAALLRATRRVREAETLLSELASGRDREADEARLMLVEMLADREPEAAQAWAAAIQDPFVAREALRHLGS